MPKSEIRVSNRGQPITQIDDKFCLFRKEAVRELVPMC